MQEAADTSPKNRIPEAPLERRPLLMDVASLSDVGRQRSENQDACGETFDAQGNRLLIVADGMGGHAGGSTASRICIETACREFRDSGAQLDERLRLAILQANADVHEVASENPELAGMGTTVVAIALAPDGEAWVGWIGDSRAYRMRKHELEPITDDHSWVAEAVKMGVIAPEEAETHPRKNQLLRSVGADPQVEVDVREVDMRPGDRFMLCSDGLWGEVPAPEIAAVLGYESPASAARKLVDRANEHGGPDNITVQILAIEAKAEAAAVLPRVAAASAAVPRKLVAGAGIIALCLLGFGWYAFRYGGGGFSERMAGEPPALEQIADSEVESANTSDGQAEEPAEAVAEAVEVAAGSGVAAGPEVAAEEPLPEPLAGAEPTGTPPRGSLAAVASGPLDEPVAFPPPSPPPAPQIRSAAAIDADVERFLNSWSRSIMNKDWAAYNKIGLPATRDEFQRDYASRDDLQMSFELTESSPQSDGTVRARVQMSYGYATTMGRRELQTEYRIRLKPTPMGLRYVGGWR